MLSSGWRDISYRLGETVLPDRMRNAGLLGAARRRAIFWARDAFVISYPKSGRTWLRTMIGRVLDKHYGLGLRNPMEVQHFWKLSSDIPCVAFTHDDEPHLKTADEIGTDKSKYARKKILLLVRDPRDVIISYYFDARNRMKIIDCSLDEFLTGGRGSIESVIAFYNAWAAARGIVRDFLLMTYEDMHRAPEENLARALEFIGVEGVADSLVQETVEYASFENLKRIERSDAFGHERMRPADPGNPDSFKVRRGKVGGYVDYLTADQMRFLDDRIAETLDPYFAMYRPA